MSFKYKIKKNNYITIHILIFISLDNIDQELAITIKNSNFSEHNVSMNYVNIPPPPEKVYVFSYLK